MKDSLYSPIAIVGISCRFPGGADSPQEFWGNIYDGVDSIEAIPPERWNSSLLDQFGSTPETQFARVGGFIHDIEYFDAEFFGISPREARDMDPQQRLSLELAWQCMEDAAISPVSLSKCSTGVFTGVISHDYERFVLADWNGISSYSGTGRSTSIVSNRISYTFDFSGPSVTIDTACSSSLVAIDTACRSLIAGETDAAIAGGVNAILMPESYIEFSQASMLSRSGYCRAFDAQADGFVRAEGGGAVLLKRLSDALVDGDRVRGVIVSTVVNQDGRTGGIMAPKADAQERMMRESLRRAGMHPSDVGYVEAHGTGTQAGDLVEATSIGKVYGQPQQGRICPVGSVKTNIGHAEGAAGIAGLIKATLAMESGVIPPSLHFENPNPGIDFEALGIRVPVKSEPWTHSTGELRAAAVNSFGFGGTNAHAIIRQAPAAGGHYKSTGKFASLLPISASSPEALESVRESVSALGLNDQRTIESICYTAQRQSHQLYRSAIPICVKDHLATKPNQTDYSEIKISDRVTNEHSQSIAFVFCGMGAHWQNAGAQLYESEPIFRSTINLCDAMYLQRFGLSNVCACFWNPGQSRKETIEIAHAVQFALQIALCDLWKSWGVVPDAVVGHSVGEIAAACTAGAVKFTDGIRIVIERARVIQQFAGQGFMLAASVSREEAENMIRNISHELFVAAVNSESSVTFSGSNGAIHSLAAHLQENGVFYRILDIPVPFHSPFIEDCKVDLRSGIDGIEFQSPQIQWFSSVHGARVVESAVEEDYWWNNFRNPVLFADALQSCIDSGFRTFVEIGPHPVLSFNMLDCFQTAGIEGRTFPTLRRDHSDNSTIRSSAGALFAMGVELDWNRINQKSPIVELPLTKFDRSNYRRSVEPVKGDTRIAGRYRCSLIQEKSEGSDRRWKLPIEVKEWAWLNEHRLYGEIVFPAAGYVEFALETANGMFDENEFELLNLQFDRMLQIRSPDDSQRRELNISVSNSIRKDLFDFEIFEELTETGPITYARGSIRSSRENRGRLLLGEISHRCSRSLAADEIYQSFANAGLEGDQSTWRIDEFRVTDGTESLALLKNDNSATDRNLNYRISPSLLDTCFRTAVATINPVSIYLPVSIQRFKHRAKIDQVVWCHSRVRSTDSDTLRIDMDIAGSDGLVFCEIDGLVLRALNRRIRAELKDVDRPSLLYPTWLLHRRDLQSALSENIDSNTIYSTLEKSSVQFRKSIANKCKYADVARQLAELTTAHIGRALVSIGFPNSANQEFRLDELEQLCGIDQEQLPYFYSLISLLEDRQVLQTNNFFDKLDKHRSVNSASVTITDSLPEEPKQAIKDLLHNPEVAEYLYELQLIDQCGNSLSSVLRGESSGLDALFPAGSMATVQALYRSSPTCRDYTQDICKSVESILQNWPFAEPCRILEIGGGTGALLSTLAPVLENYRVDYLFTDISQGFTRKARERFKHLECVRFGEFDLDLDSLTQGYERNSFDVVVTFDTLHLSRCIPKCLERIRELLVPGGFFHFVELTNVPVWARLVFGMLRGWWHNADEDRLPHSPCRTRKRWMELLADSGFGSISCPGDQNAKTDSVHSVFRARNSESRQRLAWEGLAQMGYRRMVIAEDNSFTRQLLSYFEAESVVYVDSGQKYSQTGAGYQIRPDSRNDYQLVLSEAFRSIPPPEEIVFCNFGAQDSWQTITDGLELEISALLSAAYLMDAVGQLPNKPQRISIVTSNVCTVQSNPGLTGCMNSMLWGMGRSIRNEYRNIQCRLIDIEPLAEDAAQQLFEFLVSDSNLLEVSLRGNGWYTPVLSKTVFDDTDITDSWNLKLGSERPGNLDFLEFEKIKHLPPDNSEVAIDISAAALNFRDVMVALDALPDDAVVAGYAQDSLGIECSGEVVETGSNVQEFTLGDRVVALARNAVANRISVDRNFVCRFPDNLDYEQAAGLSVGYTTALHCLEGVVQLKATDTILIHTASGGTGLAMVNLAQSVGATIYATAGTPEKKRYLNMIGVDHVSDSRSKVYASDIERWTKGAGVDVIVNTLGGDISLANQDILKSGGNFIELGKYEGRQAVHAAIRDHDSNAIVHIVDIDRMWKQEPDRLAACFKEAMNRIEGGRFPLLPFRVFPGRNASDAFRHMASAQHIGKVVLSLDELKPRTHHRGGDLRLSSDATYVVVGGTRGFGMVTAIWLSEHGARNLIVVGRSRNRSIKLKELEREATIRFVEADVTNFSALQTGIESAITGLPPIRGVIHCAMEIEDRVISNLDADSLRKTVYPKVVGAWNLHRITEDMELDFLVLYSSVASILGPSGQSAYCAANAFVDSFADYLSSIVVPAIAVNWGAVADYGYVADNPGKTIQTIDKFGVQPLPATVMLDGLGNALDFKQTSRVVIAGGDWVRSDRTSYEDYSDEVPQGTNGTRNLLQSAISCVSRVLEIPIEAFDPDEAIVDLGIDSLLAVELSHLLQAECDIAISAASLLERVSVTDIVVRNSH